MQDSIIPESLKGSIEFCYHRSASWFDSLKRYAQETDVSILDLSNMNLYMKDVTSILKILADSQICELDLSGNNLRNSMEYLSNSLIETKIKKLKVSSCQLVEEDILSLMTILKDTQISDLDISKNGSSFFKDVHAFISHLVKSKLTALNVAECLSFHRDEEALFFIQELQNTSLMHLNVGSVFATLANHDTLFSLFTNLKHTSITHLNLSGNCVGKCSLGNLCDSFRDSKLVDLDLSCNALDDTNVDFLCQALKRTKIATLNLASNKMKGDNVLGHILMQTQISSLDLGGNPIVKTKMFSFPRFLRGSSVVSLKLNNCGLSDQIGVELMNSFESSTLTTVDVSGNHLNFDSFSAFSRIVNLTNITNVNLSRNMDLLEYDSFEDFLVGSKLKHICINHFTPYDRNLGRFLESMKNSSVSSLILYLSHFHFDEVITQAVSSHLVNLQLTHLDLSCSSIGNGVHSLAANLKFTPITHLNMRESMINYKGAEVLAECLKETCIIDLNLSQNIIRDPGATALARSFSNSNIVRINLSKNYIGTDGLEALAEQAEASLITVLEVSENRGNSFRVETVIWNNRRLVHQLKLAVSFFNRIAPETGNSSLRFEDAVSSTNVDTFLEECLSFYKTVLEPSSALAVKFFARDESISLSGDQVSSILFDQFPQQFASFIANKIEAEVSEHVCLLKKAEELGLDRIVEFLLLNRPLYTIDKSQSILHPYAYKLLEKYKLPICNLNIEPQGIDRIIEYFTSFANIEGAADVIRMLKLPKP